MGVAAVEEFEAAFKEAYESGDAQRVAALYEDGAVLVQPDHEQPAVGRVAIEAAIAESFAYLSDVELAFHQPAVFEVDGDLAWGHGATTTEFSLPDGSRHSVDSKSSIVLHRGKDGFWRLLLDHAS